jgi:hypothetical protein
MNTEAIAAVPAGAEPGGFDVSTLFGGEGLPPSAVGLGAAAGPDAGAAAAVDLGGGEETAPAPGVAPGTLLEEMLSGPAAGAGGGEGAAPGGDGKSAVGFDMGAWLKLHYPEAPEGIAKVDNWKASRDINVKLIQTLAEKEAELVAARATGAAGAAGAGGRGQRSEGSGQGDGATLPETETVKRLSLEMATLQARYDKELGEYATSKAAGELKANHAFRQEHDGQRAALFDAAKEVAEEAGISEEVLKSIFDAESEYQMAKALGAVEDETAAGLLKEKANQFRGLTRAKVQALKSPTAELQKWRDYEAGMPGVLSGKITEGLRQRFAAEAQSVGKELTDPATGELFFRTPAGKAVLAQIQARFDEGFDVTPAEHVRHMAMAEAMPIYREVAAKQAAAIVELQQRLARYEKAEPAQGGRAPEGGAGKGGFEVASLFRR